MKHIASLLIAALMLSIASDAWAESSYRGQDDRYYQSNINRKLDREIETYQKLGRTNDDYKKDSKKHSVRRETGANLGKFLGGVAIGAVAASVADH